MRDTTVWIIALICKLIIIGIIYLIWKMRKNQNRRNLANNVITPPLGTNVQGVPLVPGQTYIPANGPQGVPYYPTTSPYPPNQYTGTPYAQVYTDGPQVLNNPNITTPTNNGPSPYPRQEYVVPVFASPPKTEELPPAYNDIVPQDKPQESSNKPVP